MSKLMPVIIEPTYAQSSWCDAVLSGLSAEAAKRDLTLHLLQSGQRPPKDVPVVLLGAALDALPSGIRTVIAGVEPQKAQGNISFITTDRRSAMAGLVHYLYDCGARHIALLGTDCTVQTDFNRFSGWADAVQELGIGDGIRDTFHASKEPTQCFSALLECINEYDGVCCTNDYIALHLLRLLRERGIRVPQDVMVTGFGDTRLGQWSQPTLTTVSANLPEIGRQACTVWRFLESSPKVLSVSVAVDCTLHLRDSTPRLPAPQQPPLPESEWVLPPFSHQTLRGPLSQTVSQLERLVAGADDTGLRLLQGIARQIPNEQLCEESFLSYTSFKRRLSKMYRICQVAGKKELAELLNNYVPGLGGK